MGARPDDMMMPYRHWGQNTCKVYAELARRGLITPRDNPHKLWQLAEQAAGVTLAATDSPEEAAAKCFAGLGIS